jgi:hydrophobic/amphiphilic exporter-1 (mainly G- bacteria), HAE1 family
MNTLRAYETKVFTRINPLVNFSVTRYVLAVGIFVAVAIFGIVSTLGLGVDLLPNIVIPAVVVRTSYPGATPSVMDLQVTQVLENVVSTVSGITDINSSSSQGMSRVVLTFDPSTDKYADANQVATAVAAAVRSLPANVTVPTIQTFDPNSAPILQFGIEGRGTDLAEVNDYVQNSLGPVLERIDGVATVLVDGGPSKQFEVLLNPDRLRYYNVSPQDVVAAITGSALQMPIGTIVKNNNALTFSTQNQPTDITEISRTIVDSARGIRVDQLGTVWGIPSATNYARVNGMPVVLVSVQKTTDANSVAVADSVRAALKTVALPASYSIQVSNDSTGPIRASVSATYRELLITALVVALIVLLFLGKLNTAISVILAIPIALSASPVLYKLAGFSFNLVSLLALIIAIGIVVDDSIVVSENVERYRAMGFSLREAVLRGASEVFSAVVAASLSLLSVLLPVSFIGGFIGSYLQQFSLGLAAAVAFSLLEAVLFLTVRLAYTPESKNLDWEDFLKSWTQLPQALRWGFRSWRKALGILGGLAAGAALYLLTRRPEYLLALAGYPVALSLAYYVGKIALSLLQSLTSVLHGWTEAGLEWVRDAYARSLEGVLRRAVPVLAGCVLFLGLIAVFVVPRVPFNFVPNTDSGSIDVHLRNPPGAPLAVTNNGVGVIEDYLRTQPEVETVQSIIGTSTGGVSGTFAGTNTANITVQLVPVGRRTNVFQLIPRYRSEILARFRGQPSTQVMIHGGGGFGPSGTSLQLSIVSPDFTTLLNRNGRFIQEIQRNPWVVDVYSSLSDTSLENDFYPDPSRLQGTGVSPSMIANALQTYASGVQASTVVTGGLSYPIQVQADPTTLSGVQSLLNLPIYSPALGTMVHLGQLGSFRLNQAPVSVSRYNRAYTGNFTITMKPDAPPVLVVKDRITADLQKSGLLEGGLSLTANNRFNPVTLAAQLLTTGPLTFLLALFLAYLVMAAQFNSWRYPIYLLLPVPLAIVGALLLVFAQGGGLDIFGMMGMLMLIGLSAKNAILYLDFVVERIGRMPFKEALVEAARLRFRPIIMTTMTVLVISFPLILGRGEGSEFGKNMGVVMLGGIVFSAVLTFFVVPAAFYLFERRRVDRTASVIVPFEEMQLGKNLEALEVPMRLGAQASTIYPVLLWDKKDGATLIDTGVPGSDAAIGEHLARLGLGWKDIRRIIITHQDIDHIGGANAAVKASNAEVLAHGDDIPYIQGDRRLLKMDPARLEERLRELPDEQRERVRQLFTNPPKVHVNRALVDGEKLPYGGGMVVIHTPGHTPGHISLFLTADRLLISGDALRAENGVLQGPSPTATPDLALATASLRKLLDYPIDRVLCYHGGLTRPGALARLRELAGTV